MINKKDIIDYDFQGWPVCKKPLREFFETFCKHENGNYIIKDDDPVLDTYPSILEDDGMGYGVNERFITAIDHQKDTNNVNIFAESKLPGIELWETSDYRPGSHIIYKDKVYYLSTKISKSDTGELIYTGYTDDYKEISIPDSEIEK